MSQSTSNSPSLPKGEWLAEHDGHRVWWGEGGDPQGLPVLIVHGGPGGASRIEPTRWFEGLPVRWIVLDQRGCGRSAPLGATAHNNLTALLGDMERLREHLGLAHWALAGGSWGVRVVLAYTEANPLRVRGLLLRSPFLAAATETQRYIAAWPGWLADAGRAWLGAAAADAVEALYSGGTGLLSDGTGYSLDRLATDERVVQVWSAYDDGQSRAGGVAATGARCDPSALPAAGEAQRAAWRVHAHYAAHAWGAAGPQAPVGRPLLPGAWQGPVRVVWGTADATCDPAVAQAIVDARPGVRGCAVEGAGHRMSDPLLAPALMQQAQEWVAELLSGG